MLNAKSGIKTLVIIGGGGHANVLAAIIRDLPEFVLVGFTDPDPHAKIKGINYLGDDGVLEGLFKAKEFDCLALGLGMINLDHGSRRATITSRFINHGIQFPPLVSKHAVVDSNVILGAATTVSHSAVVITGANIGTGVIVNTNASIDHDCTIGDFCHIAPGSVLCGAVHLGNRVIVGAGSVIREGISIASDTLIGAGSVVIKNITLPGIYVGNPATRLV